MVLGEQRKDEGRRARGEVVKRVEGEGPDDEGEESGEEEGGEEEESEEE